jgi:hypothetical protein
MYGDRIWNVTSFRREKDISIGYPFTLVQRYEKFLLTLYALHSALGDDARRTASTSALHGRFFTHFTQAAVLFSRYKYTSSKALMQRICKSKCFATAQLLQGSHLPTGNSPMLTDIVQVFVHPLRAAKALRRERQKALADKERKKNKRTLAANRRGSSRRATPLQVGDDLQVHRLSDAA